jgi:phage/plasmid-like protein (TIGR03299 family)
MAHEIENFQGADCFAYIGERPWHGLGQQMLPGASADDMKKAAGLDWSIGMQPLWTKDSEGNLVEVPSHRVAVRSSDGAQFTVASDRWTPTQNEAFFEFAREFAAETGSFVETAGSLRGGKTPFTLININRDFFVGRSEDVVKNYLLLSWSHVVGKANKAKAVSTRVVCANTEAMAMRERGMEVSQTHSAVFDFGAVRGMYDLAVAAAARQEADYNKLATVKLGQFDVVKFLQPLLQPVTEEKLAELDLTEEGFQRALWQGTVKLNGPLEDVLDSMQTAPGATPGQEQTGWSVLNGMTYWTNHRAGRVRDARLTSAWFGDRADMVANAKQKLLELAA